MNSCTIIMVTIIIILGITYLAISGSFSTTLREHFSDGQLGTLGILGIGRKAPDLTVTSSMRDREEKRLQI